MARSHEADVAAFNDKVVVTPCCWYWTGATVGGQESNNGGYGIAHYDGKSRLAHRVAYMIAKGPISDGLVVSHSCDTRLCQNPDHLFAVTKKENSEQMVSRGRASQGKTPNRRVSPQELQLMVTMYLSGKTWYRIGADLHRAQQLVKAKVEKFLLETATVATKKPAASYGSSMIANQAVA